jgi:catechol 2,3-dioxygenase-like lactoylglutathione lyase family enzyme
MGDHQFTSRRHFGNPDGTTPVLALTVIRVRLGGCSMRRLLMIAIVSGVLAAAAVGAAGCARHTAAGAAPAGETLAGETSAGDWPAGVKEAEVYVQVLHRYLSTPTENSFPDQTFKTIYVLDQAHPDAGDPHGKHERGTPIAPNTQHQIMAALAGVAHVAFIADRGTVIETKDGCAQARDGGILITLGPANGDDNEVQVAINGFVNCLGATWLTYVVQNQPGTGWRVTGTTGSMAIS